MKWVFGSLLFFFGRFRWKIVWSSWSSFHGRQLDQNHWAGNMPLSQSKPYIYNYLKSKMKDASRKNRITPQSIELRLLFLNTYYILCPLTWFNFFSPLFTWSRMTFFLLSIECCYMLPSLKLLTKKISNFIFLRESKRRNYKKKINPQSMSILVSRITKSR